MRLFIICCLALIGAAPVWGQTWYHVDKYQTSITRPADEPVFYSPIRFRVDTSVSLHMRWVGVTRFVPRYAEAHVATFDSLYAEVADSGDFIITADSTDPNLLEVVFMPHGVTGQYSIVVSVFPVDDPSQAVELTFNANVTFPASTAVSTIDEFPAVVSVLPNRNVYIEVPAEQKNCEVIMYDLVGRPLTAGSVSGSGQFSTGNAAPGVYMVAIKHLGMWVVRKVWLP